MIGLKKVICDENMENRDAVERVVVVEMISDRKMKMEVFVGKKAGEVRGFSGKEKMYVR